MHMPLQAIVLDGYSSVNLSASPSTARS